MKKPYDPAGAGKKPAVLRPGTPRPGVKKLPIRPEAPKRGVQPLPGKARPAQAPKAFALKQLKKFKAEAKGRNK
jgi:hypothetical protein